MGHAEWSVETIFPANPTSVAAARDYVRGHLLLHGLVRSVDDVRLVVSEFATNAIVHAQTPFTVILTSELDGSGDADRSGRIPTESRSKRCTSIGHNRPPFSIVEHVSSEWGVTAAVDGSHAKAVWASFQT